jgi:hypothetical protein
LVLVGAGRRRGGDDKFHGDDFFAYWDAASKTSKPFQKSS